MNQSLLPRPRFWALAADQKRTHPTMFGEMLRFLIVYLAATVCESILLSFPLTIWILRGHAIDLTRGFSGLDSMEKQLIELLGHMPPWMEIAKLFATAAFGIAAVFYCRVFEKRKLPSMGVTARGAAPELLAGLAIGAVLFAAVPMIGSAAHGYRVTGFVGVDVKDAILLVLALIGCAVSAASMELLLRGYLAPSLGAGMPVTFAVVFSTTLSLFLTEGLSGFLPFINMLLLSLLLCVCTIKRGNLWAAFGLRTGWLFAAKFFFGFDQTEQTRLCLVPVTSVSTRDLVTGGKSGPVGSICATIVLIVALGAVFALRAKDPAPRPEPPSDGGAGTAE